MGRHTRSFFWIAELLLLLPAIFVIEISHAYECSAYLRLWGWTEDTVDISTWTDSWMLLVGLFLVSMSLPWTSLKQSDYVLCRLCSFTTSTVMRFSFIWELLPDASTLPCLCTPYL